MYDSEKILLTSWLDSCVADGGRRLVRNSTAGWERVAYNALVSKIALQTPCCDKFLNVISARWEPRGDVYFVLCGTCGKTLADVPRKDLMELAAVVDAGQFAAASAESLSRIEFLAQPLTTTSAELIEAVIAADLLPLQRKLAEDGSGFPWCCPDWKMNPAAALSTRREGKDWRVVCKSCGRLQYSYPEEKLERLVVAELKRRTGWYKSGQESRELKPEIWTKPALLDAEAEEIRQWKDLRPSPRAFGRDYLGVPYPLEPMYGGQEPIPLVSEAEVQTISAQQGKAEQILLEDYRKFRSGPESCCDKPVIRLSFEQGTGSIECVNCKAVLAVYGQDAVEFALEEGRRASRGTITSVDMAVPPRLNALNMGGSQVRLTPSGRLAVDSTSAKPPTAERAVLTFLAPRFRIARQEGTGLEQDLYQVLLRRVGTVRCTCTASPRVGFVLDQGSTKERDDCTVLCLACNQRLVWYGPRELPRIREEVMKRSNLAVTTAAAMLNPEIDLDEARFANLELNKTKEK